MNKPILGRKYEINLLNEYLLSNKSEFIVVYGRRRVGKTYLLRNCFENDYDFSFTGTYNCSLYTQLDNFYNSITEVSNLKYNKPRNWTDAFRMLKRYLLSLDKDVVTVFLDELPWLDTHKSNFISAFSYFWNTFTEKTIKLFACGSATTWMINKLLGDKGGLYGRASRSIYLSPFSLQEIKEYITYYQHINLSNEQILHIYMVTGGIPYYIDMFNNKLPFSVNIDNLFFKQGAPLRNEFDFIFQSLFDESINYKKVIYTIACNSKGITRNEISNITKINGGVLTEILDNLRLCDFIRCYSQINKKDKDKIYQLTDMYTLFYLRFIDNDDGQDPDFWTKNINNPITNNWYGYAYEMTCLNNISSIKTALKIGGLSTNVCSWSTKPYIDNTGASWNGAQIDLLLDRADNLINIIEIKYCKDLYVIDQEYKDKIFNRVNIFKNSSKTKKGTINTIITTKGLKQNAYSYIIENQLTLDDLFN